MFVFQKTPLKIQLKFSKTFHLGGRGWSLLGRRGVKSACTLSSSADVGHVSIVRVKNFPRVKSFDFMGSANHKCRSWAIASNVKPDLIGVSIQLITLYGVTVDK